MRAGPALQARLVEPEILDALPATDPEAVGSRRDLFRINALMFQPIIMRRLLLRHVTLPPRRILEIGAGDARFMLAIARRLARRWPGVELTLLDRKPLLSEKVGERFAKLGWRVEAATADVFDWAAQARGERFDLVTTNLVLHHFDDAALARLFRLLAPLSPLFVATEPWRARLPLFATGLLPAIGANRVTLHDAAASVRAGFSEKELSRLWPAAPVLEERRVGLFTHVFAAASS
jgi:2-polyprenyl-3-methyl-5-hydroxy-6-metoxy-1,4-benzoquinol methylase